MGSPDLAHLLDRLARLSDETAAPQVRDLQHRLADGEVRVVVCGEAKRGKSTLINALVGRPVLPAGVVPLTARATWIRSGEPERVEVADGARTQVFDVRDLETLVARGADVRASATDPVCVYLSGTSPGPWLVLIDTPGVGSVYLEDSRRAAQSREGMDIAVLVLTADAPLSHSETELLHELRVRSVETIIVLNKVDLLTPSEESEVRTFVGEAVRAALGEVPLILSCSARAGLRARADGDAEAWVRSGCDALSRLIDDRGGATREKVLEASLQLAMWRIAARQLDALSVELAGVSAILDGTPARLADFAGVVRATADLEAQAIDLWRGEAQRSLSELNADAADALAPLTRRLRTALEEWLADVGELPAQQLEERGREMIAAALRPEVDQWRTNGRGRLAELVARQQRLAQGILDRAADDVARAAATFLGVELVTGVATIVEPTVPLSPYDFSPEVGWNGTAVSFVRRHGVGARARVAGFLREECARLANKHLGRARADLQAGLDDASREVQRRISRAFRDLREGLQHALSAAEQTASASLPEGQLRARHLTERQQALTSLLAELAGTVRPAEEHDTEGALT